MSIKGKSSDNTGSRIAQHYTTMSKIGSHKVGLDVLPKAMFPIQALPFTVEAGSTKNIIVQAGHSVREGDVVRFVSGANDRVEGSVHAIIDANSFELALDLDNVPLITDTYLVMRHITLTLDSDGALVTSQGPIQYIRDAVATQVTKDTTTPANTRALPVELVSTTGVEATFNVTTGDLNVASTHDGVAAAFDSIRIGDGTELLAINASNEALVKDTDVETAVTAVGAQLPATLGIKADAASLSVTQSTEDRVITNAMATDLGTIDASLDAIELQLPATIGQKANAASLAVSLSTEQEAMIDGIEGLLTTIDTDTGNIDGKLPATIGQKANAASLAVSLSTEQEAMIDGIEGLLTTIDTDTGNIDGKLPATIGQKANAASLAVALSTEQEAMIDGIEGLLTTIDTDTGNIDAKLPATLGSKADAASLAVTLSTEDKAALGSANALTVVDLLDTPLLDASSTNIPASGAGFLEVVASTAAEVKKLDIIDDMGEFIGIYTGAAASEVLVAVTKLGGGEIEVNIPAATRISLRNMKNATIATGNMAINLLG